MGIGRWACRGVVPGRILRKAGRPEGAGVQQRRTFRKRERAEGERATEASAAKGWCPSARVYRNRPYDARTNKKGGTMIRNITTQRFFLRQPSSEATPADGNVVQDLIDTLEAHRSTCVGMAANMIGQRKRIIAVMDKSERIVAMLNPRIVRADGPYETEEGCLSLEGVRPATRFRSIEVAYEDAHGASHVERYAGRVAQAIQHEIDHCNGIVI